ncbi:MAG: rhomboid family intramembrane serine protease, partial [Pseudomonadota bacterium]
MFVPLTDDNPLITIPYQFVTVALIVANVLAFLLVEGITGPQAIGFALVPAEFVQEGMFGPVVSGERFDGFDVPERVTLFSYMFMHADVLHLAGNMLFLWVFGDNVEDAMGHVKFLIFYLLCGVAGGLAHTFMMAGTGFAGAPLIGASGAVAGVVAAYLMLHPRVRLWVLVLRFIPLRVSALWALGAWIAMQFIMAFASAADPVAWW